MKTNILLLGYNVNYDLVQPLRIIVPLNISKNPIGASPSSICP
jgi:hypothetical protein